MHKSKYRINSGLRFGGRDEETEVYMSNIVGKAVGVGGSGGGTYFEFTYTGSSNYRQEDDVLELLSSGTLTVLRQFNADVFLVGGGGSGGYGNNTSAGTGGGGGGYTKTIKVTLRPKTSYEVVIGDGAAPSGHTGGTTSAFGTNVNGGGGGNNYSTSGTPFGGAGGSGGGAGGGYGISAAGGSDGEAGVSTSLGAGGSGQGTTTREFGEATGKLYAGGGGGGNAASTSSGSPGGSGGGGAGGAAGRVGNSATPNTGGGGGGGGSAPGSTSSRQGGTGGSGIVCIRVHMKN